MSFLRRWFKFWFPSAPAAVAPVPQRELLVRTPTELEVCEQWGQSATCQQLKAWLKNEYRTFLSSPADTDEDVDFLDTPSSKGFVIHFSKTNYTKQDAVCFFDYLKGQVLAQNYKSELSDIRAIQRGAWLETIQRHYLKPKSSINDSGLIRQRFGNVTIELVLRNEAVHHLRLRATAYSDHLYQDAWDFQVLMDGLVG
ncbi:MAG TPA: hypothetical protein PLC89_26120 [Haliscomenobacter sp.]|uniref:hypothetical protein n=1 Tax=Haliscomenobacter sp. TaxID=2717303 RepID=UPI002CCB732F|nr:hypothetical protein [Haliscomenobacter sp.]HOY20817.1 hypothetical protein [Haliscomenobacter sp.]